MTTKIRAFFALSLLSISFSSFALSAICPTPEKVQGYIKTFGTTQGVTNVDGIGDMFFVNRRGNFQELLKWDKALLSSSSGVVSCYYEGVDVDGGIAMVSRLNTFGPERTSPWARGLEGRFDICDSSTGGNINTCVFVFGQRKLLPFG